MTEIEIENINHKFSRIYINYFWRTINHRVCIVHLATIITRKVTEHYFSSAIIRTGTNEGECVSKTEK